MNPITKLFGIRLPIVQAGMVWCSGWRLAHACSREGILGVIGSGSMYPDVLDEHIRKYKDALDAPFAVNLPLLYPAIGDHIETILRHRVPVVITSAGSPAKYTRVFKEAGIKVVHVVSSAKFAVKAQDAGVDAVIAEGFEAGGHNGREETTTLVLIPSVREAVSIPVIAAGGIASGASMFAAMALGADGVQIGTRFAVAQESSAHQNFKQRILESVEGDTVLTLKELAPVRLIKNGFYHEVLSAYQRCATVDDLRALLGRGRAKKGIFEGDLEQGELEIGQVSAHIGKIQPAAEIIQEIAAGFEAARQKMCSLKMNWND